MTSEKGKVLAYISGFALLILFYIIEIPDIHNLTVPSKQFSEFSEEEWLQFYKTKEDLYEARRNWVHEYCETQPTNFSKRWNYLLWVFTKKYTFFLLCYCFLGPTRSHSDVSHS